MRADLWFFGLIGLANATALNARDPQDDGTVAATSDDSPDSTDDDKKKMVWHPKTNHPEFFSLRVDEKCAAGVTSDDSCKFNNYGIRLERGIAIATLYNRWWDPKLPIFFVDDDTQLYTVSKKPLQLYIDAVTGSFRYTEVGWLPPNAIALSFYKTGNNPIGLVDPSPAYLSWPSTQGLVSFLTDPWWLCPLGSTGQYQVFISKDNYAQATGPSGVAKDADKCEKKSLAAINANPWKKGGKNPW